MDPSLKQIDNKGSPVYYRFIDRGAEDTVVFVHGLFSSSSIFRHFADLVDKNVILVELRGIVYSAIQKPFIKNYVEDIRLILEKEGVRKNIILVGYSLGCAIANRFAEDFGSLVKKVVMLSPINQTLQNIGVRRMATTLIEGLGKDFFKKWREYLGLEGYWPKYKIFSLSNLKLLRESYKTIEFTENCGIVILNGLKDTFFDANDHRLKAPNIVRETIEDVDHFLFLTSERIEKVGDRLIPLLETAEIEN